MSVIASQRVGAKRRPMTGSAKQSSSRAEGVDCFIAALLAMTAASNSKTPERVRIPVRRLHFTFAITPR
jgi:hypothetical protein